MCTNRHPLLLEGEFAAGPKVQAYIEDFAKSSGVLSKVRISLRSKGMSWILLMSPFLIQGLPQHSSDGPVAQSGREARVDLRDERNSGKFRVREAR